jgi:hypothetical protein
VKEEGEEIEEERRKEKGCNPRISWWIKVRCFNLIPYFWMRFSAGN